MKKSCKTATLKDIAATTGFSVMTVSRVLNGTTANHVSAASRAQIEEAARQLRYRLNLNARNLVKPSGNVVGLMIDSQAPAFYRDTMMKLEKLLTAEGRRLQVGFVHNSLASIKQYIADFRGAGVDQAICMAHAYPEFGAQTPALLDEFDRVVFLERPLAPTRFPVIAADHYRNYHDAVAHMLARGFTRIVSVRDEYRDHAFYEAEKGMRDAYAEAGVPFDAAFWHQTENPSFIGDTAARAGWERIAPIQPEVLIMLNDEAVFWMLRALRERGLTVPEDCRLFSADLWHYGQAATPTFSGFDYDSAELARRILQHLHADNEDESIIESVPARIVWGESC